MSRDLRRGTSRFVSQSAGMRTHHSFSFGHHYDPGNVGFGPMTCLDDHELTGGHGFPDHRHSRVEIVTWVVRGELVNDGTSTLHAGQVAVQSTGTGITHSEVAGEPGCRFVQAWLRAGREGGPPLRRVAEAPTGTGRLVALVGPGAPLTLGVPGASLALLRLRAGERVEVPASGRVLLFLVTGSLDTADERLHQGDELRCRDEPGLELTTGRAADALVWRFEA